MDLVNAAQRWNDVEVFLVRMREKGLLTSIASACFKSADTIPSNASDDRQAPFVSPKVNRSIPGGATSAATQPWPEDRQQNHDAELGRTP
jgi:hypothetical protein